MGGRGKLLKLIFLNSDIHIMNLAGIDLNLLIVFDAVMGERSATRAGRKIGMSQPAVSNALNRLRHHLRDDLFVRGPEGMRPTARALELELPIRSALAEIEDALDPVAFDPSTAQRTFTIATADYMAITLLPYVASYITAETPGVNVHTIPIEGRLYERLDHQEADYGLMPLGDIPERFGRLRLAHDHFICMMRSDHRWRATKPKSRSRNMPPPRAIFWYRRAATPMVLSTSSLLKLASAAAS